MGLRSQGDGEQGHVDILCRAGHPGKSRSKDKPRGAKTQHPGLHPRNGTGIWPTPGALDTLSYWGKLGVSSARAEL